MAQSAVVQPSPDKPTVVQKFGGTSAGTGARMLQIVDIVKKSLEQDNVVVVVSAMSSHVKSEGTTSRLIAAAEFAVAKQEKEYRRMLNLIKTSHIVAIHEAMGESTESSHLQDSISEDVDQLRTFLDAVMVIGELSPRTQDFIIGMGEKLAAKILAAVCRSQGVEAVYINLDSILETGENPKDLYGEIRRRMAALVNEHVTKAVPVVTGFFGDVPGGMIDTVGRGYSDFTAAMIAAEIRARELQLWKEVDGIFSADPRKVKSARVLDRIAPAEAAELSWFGSEVIHPFTMAHVVAANVPIRIKNTLQPSVQGTVIDPASNYADLPNSHNRGAVAVSIKSGVASINLTPKVNMPPSRFSARALAIVDKHKLELSMVSTSTVSISIVVPTSPSVTDAVRDLEEIANVSCAEDMAIVSLIGSRMKHTIGVAGAMFATLAKNNVNIEMISQGASEINISCLVSAKDSVKALVAIHDGIIYGSVNEICRPEGSE
eukprot:comp9499_c0_seq1/m.4535 comp9499_c0_seq1/g.4535  ORF comp9499_c0_seq1/g.4535 comp9499_c0_seq1/m.4535 type:complete len:489 (-) comp9499_c0_seq1:619-2085(-)